METTQLQSVSLPKGTTETHYYIIRYRPGDESAVIEQIIEWVMRPDLDFDWFDAAVLSHSLGQQMTQKLSAAQFGTGIL